MVYYVHLFQFALHISSSSYTIKNGRNPLEITNRNDDISESNDDIVLYSIIF